MEGTQRAESVERAESLSYGLLMVLLLSRGTLHDFFMLSRQLTDAMNLNQRPHLIYNMVETGF
jgi:hypothetical protein